MASLARSRAAPTRAAASALRALVADLGAVFVTWGLFALAEFVVIGVTCRPLFAGNWELVQARRLVAPIAVAMLWPFGLALVGLSRLAAASRHSAARVGVGVVSACMGASVAFGVSGGRHFANPAARGAFVGAATLGAFALIYAATPVCARLLTRRRRLALVLALGLAVTFWLMDAHVLVRLYPAFHATLLALSLASAALTTVAWRSPGPAVPTGELALGAVGVLAASAALAYAPTGARGLSGSDNLRLVLDDHAPLLGRAVRVATWLSPPAETAPDAGDGLGSGVGEVPRVLDWAGADVLLVSIDALRADHLGAYGYGRGITPNLDALAEEGTLFEHAYCPTPHTSYSVTSMMTGKAMRPLLSQGLGKASDTWATYLRRYGYKTAAFYPPAVFYIDQDRFDEFERSGLGFEYRWVEFTSAETKVHEVQRYLATAGPEPLFVWVHLFEPHEPYVMHPGYEVGDGGGLSADAYDSEIKYADAAVGDLLRVMRAARPGRPLSVIVTADHGEELGDHGGRYHGTTCYEEQVRVPLLVSGPGVARRRVSTVVQTIDLLPTVLSALGIPRPARVRGRDLGPVLSATRSQAPQDPGLAYAETDDQTLLARGDDRLICARRLAACALYDVASDPLERTDRAAGNPGLTRELRALSAQIERDQGRFEAAAVVWPEALRRGLQGDADAALDVAALLDDVNVVIRRKAAEVTFKLGIKEVAPQARRALERDEDRDVRRWAALALVRMGERAAPEAEGLLRDAEVPWRRAAALAFALQGDGRGRGELTSWWQAEGPGAGAHAGALDMADAKEVLRALAVTRASDAVPSLVAALDYVPLRPAIAEALGQIGDGRAKAPLLAAFGAERYEPARSAEARALVTLGASRPLENPLTMFAGLPDPMDDAIVIARQAGLLRAARGGAAFEPPSTDVDQVVQVPQGPLRVWVLSAGPSRGVTGRVDGVDVVWRSTGAPVAESPGIARVDMAHGLTLALRVEAHDDAGIMAIWAVPIVSTLPSFLEGRPPDGG